MNTEAISKANELILIRRQLKEKLKNVRDELKLEKKIGRQDKKIARLHRKIEHLKEKTLRKEIVSQELETGLQTISSEEK
ncbi:MAG: hypothetical protein H7832_06515 [Magnetococcus sp. DMHC-6]